MEQTGGTNLMGECVDDLPCVDTMVVRVGMAELISVKLLNEAFMRFSKALGLQANLEKSSLFIAGAADHTKEELLKEIGYVIGVLPFKYLGVPLASKKLSVN
ncbi:hypothetical protein H5410_001412 [Solanum commersonii]|uniref:Reverse transcriptase n=1 Tax=Solanum commersonii TaxID=4109 RepID=A0A9J6B025_SOLCO|nr:hypothetical protein H5410_001412 [Solanum commersonii]